MPAGAMRRAAAVRAVKLASCARPSRHGIGNCIKVQFPVGRMSDRLLASFAGDIRIVQLLRAKPGNKIGRCRLQREESMNINRRAPEGSMLPAIGPNLRRRSSTILLAIGIAVVVLAVRPAAIADDRDQGRGQDKGQHWVATWATSPAANFVYVPPVPPVYPPGAPTNFAPANIQPDLGFPFPAANSHAASNQTFRSILKPDLRGTPMRVRLSNVVTTQPRTFNAVPVALQEYSANAIEAPIRPAPLTAPASVTSPLGHAPLTN